MSETPFQECQRIIRELRAELVEKDKLYVREMAKVATRDAEIERLQAICDPIISAFKSAEAEIERLRTQRADDQQLLFHYEAEIERLNAALADVAGTNHYKMQEEIERLREDNRKLAESGGRRIGELEAANANLRAEKDNDEMD